MKLPKTSAKRALALVVFTVYIVLLLNAVLFKYPTTRVDLVDVSTEAIRSRLSYSTNLVPFATIHFYLSGDQSLLLALANLAGNLAVFGPLGFLLPYVFPKLGTFRHVAFASFMVSLVLEVVQLLTGLGSYDVDDLLLNVIGAILGWLMYRAVAAMLGRAARRAMDHA